GEAGGGGGRERAGDFAGGRGARAGRRGLARPDLLERLGEWRSPRLWRGWRMRRPSPAGRVPVERLEPPVGLERVIAVHEALGEQFIERASFRGRSPLFSQASQPVKRCRDVRRVGIMPEMLRK